MARNNRPLARFILDGIPTAPRGVPQIEVTFDIDADGILHVGAKDMATSKEQKVRVEASSGLTKDEIENMVKESEAHAEEDRQRREFVENRNRLDELIYRTEKSFKELKDKLSDAEKRELEDALEEGKQALKGEDLSQIQTVTEKITKASHKIAEMMYRQAEAAGGAGATGTYGTGGDGEEPQKEEGRGEDVIDAEFTEK